MSEFRNSGTSRRSSSFACCWPHAKQHPPSSVVSVHTNLTPASASPTNESGRGSFSVKNRNWPQRERESFCSPQPRLAEGDRGAKPRAGGRLTGNFTGTLSSSALEDTWEHPAFVCDYVKVPFNLALLDLISATETVAHSPSRFAPQFPFRIRGTRSCRQRL